MRFARDAYRRFIQMFGKIVMDVPAEAFEEALDRAKERKGAGTPGHRPRLRRPLSGCSTDFQRHHRRENLVRISPRTPGSR